MSSAGIDVKSFETERRLFVHRNSSSYPHDVISVGMRPTTVADLSRCPISQSNNVNAVCHNCNKTKTFWSLSPLINVLILPLSVLVHPHKKNTKIMLLPPTLPLSLPPPSSALVFDVWAKATWSVPFLSPCPSLNKRSACCDFKRKLRSPS